MLLVDYSRQAAEFLEAIPEKHAGQIVRRIVGFAETPKVVPAEALRGYPGVMRLKAGEYRVIFSIFGEVMQIRLIDRRNDDEIYKALRRLIN